MNLAAVPAGLALEQAYRYPAPSGVTSGATRPRLALATSGGPEANPRLFTGILRHPEVAADALLAVAAVARTRYHTPPSMVARILLAADPIVTCSDERLRFESFSACCSVHARLDLLEDAVEGERLGRGTTNVDFGVPMRSALAGVAAARELALDIGLDEVSVRSGAGQAIERRVPLPARWIRGLTELAAIQGAMTERFALGRPDAIRQLRTIQREAGREVWLVASGAGVRVAHHPATGGVRVVGPQRIRVVERLERHLQGLRIFAAEDGSTAWQCDLPDGRLTLVLSPDPWRGLSGEGRMLAALAARPSARELAVVRARLRWQPSITAAEVAEDTGIGPAAAASALAALAAAGMLGLDLADGGYFHRELPFDLSAADRLQPRLRDARHLVADGGVRVEHSGPEELIAWVTGSGVEHRVRVSPTGASCTCPWFGRHRGERGPCKHVLAVQVSTMGLEDA